MQTSAFHTNAARGSMARGAAELANALQLLHLSRALSAGGLAIGTTTTKVKSANTITFTVLGKFFSKAATDDLWTLSGAVVPVSSFQKYALLLDTAGAASVQEATAAAGSAASVVWDNVSKVSPWAPLLSMLGDTKAVAGVLTIATDSTHTFTPGTTALSAAGITATYRDGLDDSLIRAIGNEQGTVVGLGG